MRSEQNDFHYLKNTFPLGASETRASIPGLLLLYKPNLTKKYLVVRLARAI
jgi:hypothetical protein